MLSTKTDASGGRENAVKLRQGRSYSFYDRFVQNSTQILVQPSVDTQHIAAAICWIIERVTQSRRHLQESKKTQFGSCAVAAIANAITTPGISTASKTYKVKQYGTTDLTQANTHRSVIPVSTDITYKLAIYLN